MTYCMGEWLDQRMIFAPDSRANAGLYNVASLRTAQTVFDVAMRNTARHDSECLPENDIGCNASFIGDGQLRRAVREPSPLVLPGEL
jgi:predicted proteasome-type protease